MVGRGAGSVALSPASSGVCHPLRFSKRDAGPGSGPIACGPAHMGLMALCRCRDCWLRRIPVALIPVIPSAYAVASGQRHLLIRSSYLSP